MAILVSAYTVVVPVQTLDARWPGGESAYRSSAPNRTYRCDGHLAGVAFMTPPDVKAWVEGPLAHMGLRYETSGLAVDVVVLDQMRGPAIRCDWVEFRRMSGWGEAHLVGAPTVPLAGPAGWVLGMKEGVQLNLPQDSAKNLEFLALDGMRALFLVHRTGTRLHIGLTSSDGLSEILDDRLTFLHDQLTPFREITGARGSGKLDDLQTRALQAISTEAARMLCVSRSAASKALYVIGLSLRIRGEYARAVPVWRAFTGREGGFVGGWMELTWCCAEAGLKDEALRVARKAVEVDPADAGAMANLGAALLAVSRRDEAAKWIDRALAANPDDPINRGLKAQLEVEVEEQ